MTLDSMFNLVSWFLERIPNVVKKRLDPFFPVDLEVCPYQKRETAGSNEGI